MGLDTDFDLGFGFALVYGALDLPGWMAEFLCLMDMYVVADGRAGSHGGIFGVLLVRGLLLYRFGTIWYSSI